jgi:PAS domain-containing protein
MSSRQFHWEPLPSRWSALVRIMLGRLVILAALLVVLTMLPGDSHAFYAFFALAFVINIPYALWLRHDSTVRSSAPLQFVIDVVVATGLIHFTGGISSELFLLYPLIILSAGIVVSGMHSLKIALLSIFTYASLIVLEMEGVLHFTGTATPSPYENPEKVVQDLMLRLFMFVFFSAASQHLASRCTYQARKLRNYQEWVVAVFNNVPFGIIALSPEHRVIFANRTAAKWLEATPESLAGKPLEAFFAGTPPTLRDPREESQTWLLRRGRDKTFPAAFTASRTSFPDAPYAKPEIFPETAQEQEVTILAIRDLTGEAEVEEGKREIQRLITAFQVGSELAHTMRNPLTAIQCGCDGIRDVVHNLRPDHMLLSQKDKELIDHLATIINQQALWVTRDLDQFLLLATKNPEELVKMADEAAKLYFPKHAATQNPPATPPAAP